MDQGKLQAELAARVDGEVRFDAGSRAAYAHDGSNYRQVPLGVVVPRSVDAAAAALAACREHGAPVLSRGGGTSLSGKARWSIAVTCLSACAPVASTGNGVRISTSGSATSSIVFEMSSASPVLMASWKRRNVALFLCCLVCRHLAPPRVDMNIRVVPVSMCWNQQSPLRQRGHTGRVGADVTQ